MHAVASYVDTAGRQVSVIVRPPFCGAAGAGTSRIAQVTCVDCLVHLDGELERGDQIVAKDGLILLVEIKTLPEWRDENIYSVINVQGIGQQWAVPQSQLIPRLRSSTAPNKRKLISPKGAPRR